MSNATIMIELEIASDRGLIYINKSGAIVTESILERRCPALWEKKEMLYPIIEDSLTENDDGDEVIDWAYVRRNLSAALNAVTLSDLKGIGT